MSDPSPSAPFSQFTVFCANQVESISKLSLVYGSGPFWRHVQAIVSVGAWFPTPHSGSCSSVQFLLWDRFRPNDATHLPEGSIVEGIDFVYITFYHTPAFRAIQKDRFDIAVILHSVIFVLRLYCFDFQMGWSLANSPRAFPSLALISFCAALSLLSRLPRWVKSLTKLTTHCDRCICVGVNAHHLYMCFGGIDV